MLKFIFCALFLLTLSVIDGQAAICSFSDFGSITGYTCELLGAVFENQNDPFQIFGSHLPGYSDADVSTIFASRAAPSRLRYIPPQIFHRFPNIQTVYLNNSQMESVAGLQSCSQIRKLDLSYNNISSIPEGAFENCGNLNSIHLQGNVINSIDLRGFRGISQLFALNLENNLLTHLIPGTFDSLPELLFISFLDNSIREVPTALFNHLHTSLTWVNLGNNEITRVHSRAFTGMRNIDIIQLFNNAISQLDSGAFTDLPSLRILNLADNFITRLDSNKIVNVGSLQDIWIANNGLNEIQRNFFSGFPNLRLVHAYSNACVDRYFHNIPTDPDFPSLLEPCFQNWDNTHLNPNNYE